MNQESADSQAKRSLFEHALIENLDLIYRSVMSWTHDQEDTEDLVQEAYLRTLQHMEASQWTDEISNIPAYVIRIARNLQNDRWRLRRRVEWESLDDKSSDESIGQEIQLNTAANVENQIYLEELHKRIPFQVIFRNISDYDLQILYLAAEGWSVAQIAEEVGENIDSLRYRLQKIYATVRYRARCYLKEAGTKSLF